MSSLALLLLLASVRESALAFGGDHRQQSRRHRTGERWQLHAALLNANGDNTSGSTDCAAGSLADTITLAVTGTIDLAANLPAIATDMTITGPGAASLTARRSAVGTQRILLINAAVTATISGLTLANGLVTGAGGGLQNTARSSSSTARSPATSPRASGGVSTSITGTLDLRDCTVSGQATSGSGGGVRNLGTLSVTRCAISDNTTVK